MEGNSNNTTKKDKKNFRDFKGKKFSGVINGKATTVLSVSGNPVSWKDHLKSTTKPVYGNLYKEVINHDYSEDFGPAIRDPFEPVDPNNLTRSEETELAHSLSTHSKRQDRVDDLSRGFEESRNKVKNYSRKRVTTKMCSQR